MRSSILWLLLILALAGCKGGEAAAESNSEWPSFDQPAAKTSDASATPLPKACELVSSKQVQALLAQEAALMADDPENCMWSSSAGVGRITLLMVQIIQNDDVAMARTVFKNVASMQGDLAGRVNEQVGEKTTKTGRALDGLGDEAWLSSASFGGSFGPHQVAGQILLVRKGTRLLTLNVTGSTKAEGLGQRMEALARATVPKL